MNAKVKETLASLAMRRNAALRQKDRYAQLEDYTMAEAARQRANAFVVAIKIVQDCFEKELTAAGETDTVTNTDGGTEA